MTPVTRSSARLAVAALVLGAPIPPVGPLPTLLEPLAGQESSPPPAADWVSYGSTHAPDGVLRSGCRRHPYRYAITTPTADWTLETYLRDRTGDSIAAGVFMSDSDPAAGRSRFLFCRHGTRPGWFTIEAKVHWYDEDGGHLVWLEPSHFRLRRPR